MIGRLVGRYRIVSKIGEGGMGVVYRARDEVLNRDVALKVLAESPVIEGLDKDHLLHEARAGSALNHPNICTVYEILEIDGELYFVMELIEGKSLRLSSATLACPSSQSCATACRSRRRSVTRTAAASSTAT